MSKFQFSIGEKIMNRYTVEDVRKNGAFLTYFCHDQTMNRRVVIKSPLNTSNGGKTSAKRFVQAAQRWIMIGKESHIVEAYYLFTLTGHKHNDVPYLVLEFVQGDPRAGASLDGWIGDSRLDLKLMLYFSHALCSGMMELQKKLGGPGADFVHFGLTPRNILVTHEGTLKITDIGMAKAASRDSTGRRGGEAPFIARGGIGKNHYSSVLKGNPAYLSPEQCMRLPAIDRRSDIYSLGCIMYEMCTKKRIFQEASDCELFTKHIEQVPETPKKWNPGIPRSLERLILSCLAKNPAERPSDFEEIRESIGEIIKSANLPPGVRFWLFGFSALTDNPRVKSDMNVSREFEISILAKLFGRQYVMNKGFVKDMEELELILAKKRKANTTSEQATFHWHVQAEDLIRSGDAFLQMAMDDQGDTARQSALTARYQYGIADRMIPGNPQIQFRIAMFYRTYAGLLYETNQALTEKFLNIAIEKYDSILKAQMEPDLITIGDTSYLLPFHAMFGRGTVHAARGQFAEAISDMETLSAWIKKIDRSEFKACYEALEQEISGVLSVLKVDEK